MRILNISSIIPLEGLKRENDIVLRIQDYLNKKYGYEFIIAKSLPYAPKILGLFSNKWKKYNKYIKQGKTDIEGYNALIYPWLMLPTSNLWLNYLLLPLNLIFFKIFFEKKLLSFAQNFDLILAQNDTPDAIVAYLLARATGKPYILNARGNFNPVILKLPFISKVYGKSKQIITHSPQNFQRLKPLIKIQLIPHPVDSLFFNTQQKQLSKRVEFISVCRLLKLKNLNLVINVLADLKKSNYDFIYHIIGDGPEMDNLKRLSFDNGLENVVFFHGFKNSREVNYFLNKSTVFIMPSYPETLGRAYLEAAASNCLIIGHKDTGVDGLFAHNESAIFVDKNTISIEISKLFKNNSEMMIKKITANSRMIVNDLSWLNVGETYNFLLNKNENRGL
jgi:glycosyltransferase involved in cell wall biosynthesis